MDIDFQTNTFQWQRKNEYLQSFINCKVCISYNYCNLHEEVWSHVSIKFHLKHELPIVYCNTIVVAKVLFSFG